MCQTEAEGSFPLTLEGKVKGKSIKCQEILKFLTFYFSSNKKYKVLWFICKGVTQTAEFTAGTFIRAGSCVR